MTERERIEQEAHHRGWTCRRGAAWTSFARNEFRLAIDWSDTESAVAAELSIAGGSGIVARRNWRSSSTTPGTWALNVLQKPLLSPQAHNPRPGVERTQQYAFVVAAALAATANELRRLSLMLDGTTPTRAHLIDAIRAYTHELDREIYHLYLDTPTASAAARLRQSMEES